jgi:hypothetical protein
MVAMVKCQEDLHKIIPNRIFGYYTVLFLSLLNNPREIATAAVFHEYIEDASISVYKTIVVSHDVFVV